MVTSVFRLIAPALPAYLLLISATTAMAQTAVAPGSHTRPAASQAVIPDYGGRDSAPAVTDENLSAIPPMNPLGQAWRSFEALAIVLICIFAAFHFMKRSRLLAPPSPLMERSPGNGASVTRLSVENGRTPSSGVLPLGRMGSWLKLFPPVGVDSGAAEHPLRIVDSTVLPGPTSASVHLLDVEGRRFLVATAGSAVSLLADWDETESVADSLPFREGVGADPPGDDTGVDDAAQFESYLRRVGMASSAGEKPESDPRISMLTSQVSARLTQATDRLQALAERTRQDCLGAFEALIEDGPGSVDSLPFRAGAGVGADAADHLHRGAALSGKELE